MSRCTTAASIGCTATKVHGRAARLRARNSRPRSSAGIRTTSPIRGYDLDFAILRAYENEKPASTPHFLKWNAKGAGDDELVFVSGHPGGTERLKTLAQLEFSRDHFYPWLLNTFERRLKTVRKYGAGGPERARQAQDLIFGIENSVKAMTGEFEGMKDAALMSAKHKDEEAFRARVDSNPEWKKLYGSAWDTIALVQEKKSPTSARHSTALARLRRSRWTWCDTPGRRRCPMPNVWRDSTTRNSSRCDSGCCRRRRCIRRWTRCCWPTPGRRRSSGAARDDPFIKAALGGRSPAEVANEVTSADEAGRSRVPQGADRGRAGGDEAATDPFVALARRVEPILRQQTLRTEQEIEGQETAAERAARPGAVRGLRQDLEPGRDFHAAPDVRNGKGYPMNGTARHQRRRSTGSTTARRLREQPPYDLPKRLLERKDRIDMSTPLNFVNTCDIIGGNSGSPVVNRNGELVGLIFDGNIERWSRTSFTTRARAGRRRPQCRHHRSAPQGVRAGELADVLEARVATPAR